MGILGFGFVATLALLVSYSPFLSLDESLLEFLAFSNVASTDILNFVARFSRLRREGLDFRERKGLERRWRALTNIGLRLSGLVCLRLGVCLVTSLWHVESSTKMGLL
jgi:hypothetical protein